MNLITTPASNAPSSISAILKGPLFRAGTSGVWIARCFEAWKRKLAQLLDIGVVEIETHDRRFDDVEIERSNESGATKKPAFADDVTPPETKRLSINLACFVDCFDLQGPARKGTVKFKANVKGELVAYVRRDSTAAPRVGNSPRECRLLFFDARLCEALEGFATNAGLLDADEARQAAASDDSFARALQVVLERLPNDKTQASARLLSAAPAVVGELDATGAARIRTPIPTKYRDLMPNLRLAVILTSPPHQDEAETPSYVPSWTQLQSFQCPVLPAHPAFQKHPILSDIYGMFHWVAFESFVDAKQQLTEALGELAERFGATCGSLFQLTDQDRLVPLVRHNVAETDARISLDDSVGIISYVARHHRGYCAPDTNVDPLYRDTVPHTRSEITVPVLGPPDESGEQSLLGVVNLECTLVNAFSPAQVAPLQSAAGVFLPGLLVIQALSRRDEGWLAWSPNEAGWDLTAQLQRLCHTFAAKIDPNTALCSLWYVDHAKSCAFVYATNGYDVDYRNDRLLPLETSYVGKVAQWPRGVYQPDPRVDFLRRDKADRMGIKAALFCPIHSPNASHNSPCSGVLSIYFPDNSRATPAVREALQLLADLIGQLAVNFDQQRQRLAHAQLTHLLSQSDNSLEADFECILSSFKAFFDADGVSVFGALPSDNQLRCAASTGLCEAADPEQPHRVVVVDPSAVEYDCDKDESYTIALANHAGATVRIHNVLDREEHGLPCWLPRAPLRKFREHFFPNTDIHRRLLGYAVAENPESTSPPSSALLTSPTPTVPVTRASSGTGKMTSGRHTSTDAPISAPTETGAPTSTLGVFRIVRRPGTRFFTRSDERLVHAIAGTVRPLLARWQARQIALKKSAGSFTAPPRIVVPTQRVAAPCDMAPRVMAPLVMAKSSQAILELSHVVTGRATRASFDDVVRLVYKAYEPVVRSVELYVRHGAIRANDYRLHAYYSEPDSLSPLELVDRPFTSTDLYQGHGDEWLRRPAPDQQGAPFALAYRSRLRDGTPGLSVRVPVLGWSGDSAIQAILAVEFASETPFQSENARCEEFLLKPLWHAACRLEAIWNGNQTSSVSKPRTLNPTATNLPLRDSMRLWGDYARETFACGAKFRWDSLDDQKWFPVVDLSTRLPTNESDNLDARSLFAIEATSFGVRHDKQNRFSIPLNFGTIPKAYCILELDDQRDALAPREPSQRSLLLEMIEDVTNVWTQLLWGRPQRYESLLRQREGDSAGVWIADCSVQLQSISANAGAKPPGAPPPERLFL